MKKSILNFLKKCQSGSVAIEAAVILPIFILLYFGMLDVTKLVGEHRKSASISGMISDLIGQNRVVYFTSAGTEVPEQNLKDFFQVASMIMKPKTDANLRIRVAGYGMVSGAFKLKWAVNNGKGPVCKISPDDAKIQAEMVSLSESTRDVIMVQSCAKTKLYYGHILKPFFSAQPEDDFDVEQYVLITPRLSNFIECYTAATKTTGTSDCPKTL